LIHQQQRLENYQAKQVVMEQKQMIMEQKFNQTIHRTDAFDAKFAAMEMSFKQQLKEALEAVSRATALQGIHTIIKILFLSVSHLLFSF
jgi:hypothetical protein